MNKKPRKHNVSKPKRSALTPTFIRYRHVRDTIIKCFKLGMSVKAAAKIVGYNHQTIRTWIRRGEEAVRKPHYYKYQPNDEDYAEFYKDVQDAVRDGILRRVARIDKQANKDWKADRWLLECQHPDIFSSTGFEHETGVSKKMSANIADYDAENEELEIEDVVQVAERIGVPLPKIKEHIDE